MTADGHSAIARRDPTRGHVSRSLTNGLVTLVVGPGILTHEYAHYAACRLHGVGVHERPSIGVFEDSVLVHDPVERFGVDLSIAVAPTVVNSTLAFLAALLAHAAVPGGPVWLWLAVVFGFTSFPSRTDTATLFSTSKSLPRWLRPVGYLVAAPIRAVTASTFVAGLLVFAWTAVVVLTARGAVPG